MPSALNTRVLIVDDNRDAADLLGELLTLHGYTTSTAYDGFMALEAALAFEPQIILLDLGMPKYSGNEVAPMLRQVKKLEDVYIIALTSWGDSESRALTSRNGFNLHLIKSTRMSELLAALELGCESHAHAVRLREASLHAA
jgi:DNA-binding response OmpR family regulator